MTESGGSGSYGNTLIFMNIPAIVLYISGVYFQSLAESGLLLEFVAGISPGEILLRLSHCHNMIM